MCGMAVSMYDFMVRYAHSWPPKTEGDWPWGIRFWHCKEFMGLCLIRIVSIGVQFEMFII